MPPKTKLKEETESIYTIYFDLFQKYQSEYGKNTIVLLQVGAFFEIYGLRIQTGEHLFSNIDEISQITQLAIADKGIDFTRSSPNINFGKPCSGKIVMAGFRDHRLDFYVQRFTEAAQTVVVYVQKKDGRAVSRELYQIYSPGSFIPYESESQTTFSNHIMCIWFDSYSKIGSNEKHIVYGLSTVNIFTGETSIYEYDCPFLSNPTTFDELERYLSIIQPNEVIIISTFDKEMTQLFLNYSGLKTQNIHQIFFKDESKKDESNSPIDKNIENANRCTNQIYISHVLTTFFGEDCFHQCREFSEYSIATQSFCYLMHFIQAHNPDLVRKIEYPVFNNLSNRLYLANHTLKQLNIINDGSDDAKISGHLSSVLTFLNKCCTAPGKRGLRTALTTPLFDECFLEKEYDMISRILDLDKDSKIDSFRKILKKIRDIERISRQIVIKKIYPSSIFQLYESIGLLRDCFLEFQIYPEIQEYLSDNIEPSVFDEKNMEILSFINENLYINECASINSMNSIDRNIIRPGISTILDGILREYSETCQLFERIREFFNGHMKRVSADSSTNDDTEYIKIHETEKSGSSLQITKKRGLLLKSVLEKVAIINQIDKNNDKILEITPDFHIPLKDIRFIKATSTNDEIEFPQLTRILQKMYSLKERFSSEISKEYWNFLDRFERKYYNEIHSAGKYIGKLDILLTKAYIAKTYHYCRPTIDSSPEKSFINVIGLRHPLIEHLQQNETYVTNDLIIGDGNIDGILIYGTNAVGKTSFIRALGVSIILAQAGFYVPCTEFTYKPYTAIFSRILGNDNIFKGLSTFAVEMSELRVILRLADENSLILGDELCSGTETESALSIFTAGLMDLHEKRATFLFATHFHEICNYDEIKCLDRMQLTHMSVHYDAEIDALVYDRLLKPGSGNRMYGLEVCKSLYLGNDFLNKAYEIRNKYHPNTDGQLSFGKSHFNSKKVVGFCEICKSELAEEVHHLSPQRDADKDGFIKTNEGIFHKNHKGNLAAVCGACHDKIHSDEKDRPEKIIKKKKTTNGYVFTS